MKKYIGYGCVIFFLLYLLVLPFIGAQKAYEIANYQDVLTQILDEKTMSLQDQKFLRRFYELHQDEYEEAIVYAKESAMDVEEVAIIQGRDEEACQRIEQQLLNRIEKQKLKFKGYGIEQIEILDHAQVLRKNNTVILLVMKDQQILIEAFDQMK